MADIVIGPIRPNGHVEVCATIPITTPVQLGGVNVVPLAYSDVPAFAKATWDGQTQQTAINGGTATWHNWLVPIDLSATTAEKVAAVRASLIPIRAWGEDQYNRRYANYGATITPT